MYHGEPSMDRKAMLGSALVDVVRDSSRVRAD
jgi:hypothetical protein